VSPAPDPWECAYGENAWQAPARLVHDETDDPLAIGKFTQLEGSPLSFNNLAELDRELQTITHIAAAFDVAGSCPAIAVGTKHGNPCGAAVAQTPAEATRLMVTGDTRAIFGGCVILGFEVDDVVASELINHPSESRLLANPALGALDRGSLDTTPRQRPVRGGVLQQPNYTFVLDLADPAIEHHGELTEQQARDLLLAWAVGATSNSNTSTVVRDGQLLGNGVGQQDRVGGCALAVTRARDAGHEITGAAAYSDSFFPFPDGPQVLIDAGVTAIFSTSGSVRDDAVRAAVRDAGVALVQLPDRAARGFFGH
jgi:phosphoribosylaminoimidazolecarboxamide formyltransferase/IMP cyclohydrolase